MKKELCVKLVIYVYAEMHGQQNMKFEELNIANACIMCRLCSTLL
jgi:hypothetical protein